MSSTSSNANEATTAVETPSSNSETFSARWSRTINRIHEPYLQHVLHPLTQSAARNPKTTVSLVTLLSVALVALGMFTNFNVETDGDLLWTPMGVRTVEHRDWILEDSGFPLLPRSFLYFVHNDGGNVLQDTNEAVRGLFQALDAVRSLPGYESACVGTTYTSPFTKETTCEISGPVRFWNNSAEIFDQADPADTTATLSQMTYPDGTPVSETDLYGFAERDSNGRLVSAQGLITSIDFPETSSAESFESDALDAVLAIAKEWDKQGSLRLEVLAERSIDDEIEAAIVADIPLVPIVFTIMGIFTSAIFSRRDPVQSRSFLGFTAVLSVFLSIMSGYGLMFICGINFTSMTQLLPFVIFGVGLDDTFVIMGAYARTDPKLDPLERIYETMEEVGTSVTLTTLTSTLAFGLGCLASVPAVYWLCLYAVPTILFVYLYQITFFVAAIIMDEKRIAENRRDLFRRCGKRKESESDADTEPTPSIIERFIDWYAEFLLQPAVKVVVLVAFTALLGLCAWSATQLTQAFDVADVMPDGSYASDFLNNRQDYTQSSGVAPYAYFRYVNQSLPEVQDEMKAYIDDLVTIEAIPNKPDFFWVVDFQEYVQNNTATIGQLSFNEQLDAFFAEEEFNLLYGPHIIRDFSGDILTSRVRVFMDKVEVGEVNQEIDALQDQDRVTKSQPINQDRSDYAFMTYDDLYQIWEFYAASVEELILTTILGVVSVTIVALLFIPHYTAALFVLPMISILYVDLLGVMQWGGVTIDPVSYVTCVMSIGLLVDFIIHVLLRYYECPGNRREKTVAMLKSMGVSILTGGLSTFLGTMLLAFSTSTIFRTIFIAFVGLSTLGVAHGLIVLPVVLSMIGPEDHIMRESSLKSKPSPTKNLEHEETAEAA